MKKILFTHNDFSGYWIGRLRYLHDFFKSKSIEFIVLEIFGKGSPYDFQQNEKTANWWFCLFPESAPGEKSRMKIQFEFFNKMKEINPDYIIAGPIVFSSGALALRWAKDNKKRIMVFDDAKHSFYKRNFVVNYIKRKLYTQSEAFLLPSTDYDEEYLEWGVSKDSIYYGLNCVDNSKFAPITPFHQREDRILFVGRLVPVKNLERLLKAWKLVTDENKNFQLFILGDGNERDKLNRMINDLELERVHLIGKKNNEEIVDYLNNSKALILPSISESWGLVINEAMSTGLPILSSKYANAANTLVEEGVNGFIFDPYSEFEIAKSIKNFIQLNEKEKNQFAKNSIEKISLFNYSYLAKEIERFIISDVKPSKKKFNFIDFIILRIWKGKTDFQSWDQLK